jgi:hypothetical protein
VFQEIRERSFATFPNPVPAARSTQNEMEKGKRIWITEPGIELTSWSTDRANGDDKKATLVVLDSSGHAGSIPDWAKPWVEGRVVQLIEPRGVGSTAWTVQSPPNYVERSHVLVGRTVDEGRVRDIAAIARGLASGSGPQTWKLVGRGPGGILAAYAALFEPAIGEVVVIDPPSSHRQGPIFLNVLQILDIPDALGLLAPKPLTLIHAPEAHFQRTARIYQTAGAAEMLHLK